MKQLARECENECHAEIDVPWWVVHVRPRCEKKMDQWFVLKGMERNLPVRRVVRNYPGKSVVSELPLFSGYCFGRFSLLKRNAVYGSGYAAGILEVADQNLFLKQLNVLGRVLESGALLEECPYFQAGQRVKIRGGELKGMSGIVNRASGRTRLILSVDFLQKSVAVEIDAGLLSPAA